jgi:hypothetical protein
MEQDDPLPSVCDEKTVAMDIVSADGIVTAQRTCVPGTLPQTTSRLRNGRSIFGSPGITGMVRCGGLAKSIIARVTAITEPPSPRSSILRFVVVVPMLGQQTRMELEDEEN